MVGLGLGLGLESEMDSSVTDIVLSSVGREGQRN